MLIWPLLRHLARERSPALGAIVGGGVLALGATATLLALAHGRGAVAFQWVLGALLGGWLLALALSGAGRERALTLLPAALFVALLAAGWFGLPVFWEVEGEWVALVAMLVVIGLSWAGRGRLLGRVGAEAEPDERTIEHWAPAQIDRLLAAKTGSELSLPWQRMLQRGGARVTRLPVNPQQAARSEEMRRMYLDALQATRLDPRLPGVLERLCGALRADAALTDGRVLIRIAPVLVEWLRRTTVLDRDGEGVRELQRWLPLPADPEGWAGWQRRARAVLLALPNPVLVGELLVVLLPTLPHGERSRLLAPLLAHPERERRLAVARVIGGAAMMGGTPNGATMAMHQSDSENTLPGALR